MLDTVEQAELDLVLHSISEETVAMIGRSLLSAAWLTTDRAVGNFLIREVAGYDVVLIVGREAEQVVITIGRIRPPDPDDPTEDLLRKVGAVAIFRGATGV